MSKTIPGPKGRFLIGNLGQIDNTKVHVSLYKWKNEHGNIFEFWMFSQRVIVISDVSLMDEAFSRQTICHRPDDFLKHVKYDGSGYLDSNFSDKDLALRSAVWKAISTIKGDDVLEKLREAELETFLNSLEGPSDVPIVEYLMKSTAKQYAAVLTGIEATDTHRDAVIEWLESLTNIFSGGKAFLLAKLPWLQYIPSPFKRSVDRLIAARDHLAETLVTDAKTYQHQSQAHGILQNMLIANGQSKDVDNTITDENLTACSMDILFNSVTPAAHFVAFTLLQTLKFPDMQQKIHDELDKVTKEIKVTDVLPENTPYLEAFILESMRVISVVILTKPHLVSEDTVVDGYLFPKGSIVLGDLFGMHHDEQFWDQPWSFNPERFLDKDGKILPRSDPARKRLAHFGLGMRKCRGIDSAMEHIYRYVLGIFARYKVVPSENSELPSNDPMEYPAPIVPVVPNFECRFDKK